MEEAKQESQQRASADAWAVFFSCIADKEGFGLKRMVRVWKEAETVIREINAGKTTYDKLDADIRKCCGLRLFDVGPLDVPQNATRGDVARARNWSKHVAECASWCIFFTALRRSEKYGPERLRRVWKEIEYMQDSIRRGMVTADDLRKALEEETGIYFNMDLPEEQNGEA